MSGRTVVVLPGRNFGPSVPQLFLPMFAALRRGAEPRAHEWRRPDELLRLPRSGWAEWVVARAEPVLRDLSPESALVIAKSLGTLAAGAVADLGVPAIWVTPLLTDPMVRASLSRATAPMLLVGGTGDESWDGAAARSLTPHVLELAGADHGLFVPGPLQASVANLGLLAEASERFLDEVVWPER